MFYYLEDFIFLLVINTPMPGRRYIREPEFIKLKTKAQI